MEFRILGPLEVLEDGRHIDLGGAKQRALLAVLLLHANEVVSTDALIDALWEEDTPESGRKALRVYVSGLRKVLGKDRLETKAAGYLLRIEDGELDLELFRHLADGGEFARALALWRGSPLSEFAYQRFAQAEIARLEELRLACLEDRMELSPWAALNAVDVPEGMRGSVSRYLGLLASTMKYWDDAERHFGVANERMGARPWLAHTREDYGRMLVERDGPGDREKGQELLDNALATYRELGMAGTLAKATALAAR
jgi:Bacterial transcriptional activator domain